MMAVQRIFARLIPTISTAVVIACASTLPASAASISLASCRTVILNIGSRGACVTVLQSRLQALGYFRRSVTDYYGSVTAEAEKGFETMTLLDRDRNGELDISGRTDSTVWTSLASNSAPHAPARTSRHPGIVLYAVAAWHLETFVWYNQIQVVDAGNRIVRVIKIAGNPFVASTLPRVCAITARTLHNIDVTRLWRLGYYTRMCAGRGVGTHAIPINVHTGAPSMAPSGLGLRIGSGLAPMSHGCNRMLAADAKYIYDRALGHRVYTIL